MKKVLLVLMLALAFLPMTARAEDKPLLSWSRLALSAGIDRSFYGKSDSQYQAPVSAEWRPGLFAAYTIAAPREGAAGPIVTLAGSVKYVLDTKYPETNVGVRIGLKPAK